MAETQETTEVGAELKTLKTSFEGLELTLELPKGFSGAEAVVEGIYAATQKIGSGVAAALKWLEDKEQYIASIADRMKRKIASNEWGKKQDEVEGYLEACLCHSNEYYKLAAAMAYLKYSSSLTFKSIEDANKMLADLENRGLLVKTDNSGSIPIGYHRYELGNFGLEPEDKQEIEKCLAIFSRKLMTLENQKRQSKSAEMKKKADIGIDELWNGGVGKCFMGVPPEAYEDRNGNTRWRRGGNLVVEATEKEIVPVSASGSLEKPVKTMREMDIRLPRYTLEWELPPGAGQKAFDRLVEGIMRGRDISSEEAEEYANKIRALWYLLIRAKKAADAKEELDEVKEEFRERSSITQQQFFGLNEDKRPENGIACLEFEGAFHTDGKSSVYNLFFLAERTEEDGRTVVEIVDMPPHIFDLLGACANKKFSEGKNFGELPGILRRVVRAIRSQQDMAAEISKV